MHTAMAHVYVQVALTHRSLQRRQVYRLMPRVTVIGRGGSKHKKKAHDTQARGQPRYHGPAVQPGAAGRDELSQKYGPGKHDRR